MQRRSRGLGLGYLLYGVSLGWWSLTIAPGALSVLRFGTLGLVQLPTQRTLLLCGVAALRPSPPRGTAAQQAVRTPGACQATV